ncbi:MAG: hypothetical protein COB02_16705 [Candidatus Cloacimonadota bacterium]|nr:MAG: hypothetical protein COB02_16705 [Candidatus Cloacimonadota bacterium]
MELKMKLDIEEFCPEMTEEKTKEFLVSALYSTGKIPSKIAREIIGVSRRGLSELLEKFDLCTYTEIDENDLNF